MNYTEKYHLPQWEEQDRVMRTDFNQMCAELERALTASGQARRRLERLARDEYRREVQGRVCHGRGGFTDAMWVNAMTTLEEAGGDWHGWNGRYGISLGPAAAPTLEGIEATAKEESKIHTVNSIKEAAVTFTSDGYGMMTSVGTWSSKYNTNVNKDFNFTIVLTRLDTGEIVGEEGPFLSDSQKIYMLRKVTFPLEAGIPYRLSFRYPEGCGFSGESGFALASSQYLGRVTIMTFSEREASENHSGKVHVPECASGAIGIIRWKGDGSVSLSIDGEKLQESATRETVNADGESCYETELSAEGLTSGEHTAMLSAVHNGGDFHVYDFGLIWK